MKRNIQIRSVPDALHRELKTKAVRSGKTLTDFLLNELKLIAATPTLEELSDRLQNRSRVRTKLSPTNLVRLERMRS